MAVKIFFPAAVAGLVLSGVAAGALPAAAQQSPSVAADSTFIQTASSLGLLQVKLGNLAAKKGSSPAVVEYGRRMVADYSKANDTFAAAAKQAAFPSPVLIRQHQQVFEQFQGLGRSSFDKAYMAEMVKEHGEEVELFQKESKDGRVQSLKQLASNMLPDLQQRLALATETARSIGVQVASVSPDADSGSTSSGK
jgi:putative membrane protein